MDLTAQKIDKQFDSMKRKLLLMTILNCFVLVAMIMIVWASWVGIVPLPPDVPFLRQVLIGYFGFASVYGVIALPIMSLVAWRNFAPARELTRKRNRVATILLSRLTPPIFGFGTFYFGETDKDKHLVPGTERVVVAIAGEAKSATTTDGIPSKTSTNLKVGQMVPTEAILAEDGKSPRVLMTDGSLQVILIFYPAIYSQLLAKMRNTAKG